MSTAPVDACCNTPPTVTNYQPVGETIQIGDLSVYVTGEKGKPIILNVYDIFGVHKCTSRMLDIFASHGYRLVQPDYFRGNPWPFDEPIEFSKLLAHMGKEMSEERVYKDTEAVLDYFKKTEGATKFGVIGICLGASYAVKIANRFPEIKSVASPHPTLVNVAAVADLKVPLYLIVTKDDAPHLDVLEAMKKKGGDAEKYSGVSSYPDVHHGFMGARWDETSDNNTKRVQEGVHEFVQFFKSSL